MKNILFFLFASFAASAQILSPIQKSHPQMDDRRLAYIDTVMEEYIQKNWLVGSTILVVKDNAVVYHKSHGLADLANKKPMPADAIYRIMSQTKAITSVAIMQLFEQGKLRLDQAVGDFIPEYASQNVLKEFNPADSSYTTEPAKRKITIRDLLSHRSGIDYAGIGSDNMKAIYAKAGIPSGLGNINAQLLDKMKALGRLPLVHQPGEKFTYGLNTDLLGCLVEVISGKTLDEYFKENIFEPLGMKDTYFTVPLEKSSRMPKVYTENAENQIIPWDPTFRNLDPNYPLFPRTYFSGGAGLSASTFDYAIFLQMLVNGGMYNGKQILGRRTIELMTSPQIAIGNDHFGLGFRITSKKSADQNMFSEGTYSWGGYYGTSYYVDPKEKLITLIMTQHTPNSHGEFNQKVENIIYSSLKK
ncbi:serine hydrolase domain-containing protein [Aquirufa sp.]|jgi:CubicO group peptidase (beta-lactamase class C family)|uniref:serine hydrolase domain-containing protein n=1 Tax=Aquirufa sp. TaxID=2676249 RepID=UPI0037BF8901